MAGKYYAVKEGKTPGIYFTWDDCRKMVDGYPGAKYKSFSTLAEAEAFLGEEKNRGQGQSERKTRQDDAAERGTIAKDTPYAFVDGSFREDTGEYGYGGFLVCDGEKHILQGSGFEPEMASMRNVAGEVLGSMAAVEKAMELGITRLTVYYDYMGIEMWATGGWKRNKPGTIAYHEFIQKAKNQIELEFVKVKGHSGVDGNEEADRLAKEAIGLF